MWMHLSSELSNFFYINGQYLEFLREREICYYSLAII